MRRGTLRGFRSDPDGGGVPRNLNEVLSWEEERVVQRDWTMACAGKWYQLDRQHEALSLAGRKVVVRTLREGQVQLAYRGSKLKWKELPQRPERAQRRQSCPAVRAIKPPDKTIRGGVRDDARGAQRGLGVRDCGQPPLRSGLPSSRTPKRSRRTTNNKRGHSLLSSNGDISKEF